MPFVVYVVIVLFPLFCSLSLLFIYSVSYKLAYFFGELLSIYNYFYPIFLFIICLNYS